MDNSPKKEFVMIIVVIAIAFSLTVAGIIYLTSLLTEKPDAAAIESKADTSIPKESKVMRFTLEDQDDFTKEEIDTKETIIINKYQSSSGSVAPNAYKPSIKDQAQYDAAKVPVIQGGSEPVSANKNKSFNTKTTTSKPKTETKVVNEKVEIFIPDSVGAKQTPPVKLKQIDTKAGNAVNKPSQTAKSGSKKTYQLQLFALKSLANAQAEAGKLKKDFPDIFILKVDLGSSGTWYRVRCCETDSKAEAQRIKELFEKKYDIRPNIVTK